MRRLADSSVLEALDRLRVELQLDAEVVKVTDVVEIEEQGAMITPALAVDGRIVVAGKVPAPEELKALLK